MNKIKKHAAKYLNPNPTIQLFLAVGLYFIAVYASRGGQLAVWEVRTFDFIYGFPRFMRPLFLAVTQFGSIYVLGFLAIFYLIKRHYHIVLRLLLTGITAYLVTGFAKDIWGRARPAELIDGVVSLDFAVRGPGFPSGHTALATALALTMQHYLPKKYRWLAAVWIVGVGLSRIYLGVHAPLDIVGGFAIGWGSYAIFRHVRISDVSFAKKRSKQVRSHQ